VPLEDVIRLWGLYLCRATLWSHFCRNRAV
jgi:hypothetical protein